MLTMVLIYFTLAIPITPKQNLNLDSLDCLLWHAYFKPAYSGEIEMALNNLFSATIWSHYDIVFERIRVRLQVTGEIKSQDI